MTIPLNYGSQSMVALLRRVLVRRPDASVAAADPQRWHYSARIDIVEAQREHDAFVQLLQDSGAEVVFHDEPLPDHADAQFTHDPSLVCEQGAIILKMGKALRVGEEDAQAAVFTRRGVPIHARLHGEAQGEGGDMLWLDERTLLVGIGFRTNMAAVEQLRAALPGVDVLPFDMPCDMGVAACLHIMSFISLLDRDLAVVHLPLMPVRLFQLLRSRGVQLVEVPAHEYVTMSTNVLAVAPRDCIMLQGNPITRARLEAAGCRVRTYKGDEISLKAEGGATCLTRPIWRSF
jgi:N-dimethylarginine dimethylaminohydrolase